MCVNCGSSEITPCSCSDGYNSFTITTGQLTVTGSSFSLSVSNTGQYTGKWAIPGQKAFIAGFGYYEIDTVTNTTPSTIIKFKEPPSPFVGGTAFVSGSVDYKKQSISGNYIIYSGTKISPAGEKGQTGINANENVQECFTDSHELSNAGDTLVDTVHLIAGGSTTDVVNVDGDTIEINARIFFKNLVGTGHNGAFRIVLFDGANNIDLTIHPVNGRAITLGGSDGPDFADVKVVVKRATSTSLDREVHYSLHKMLPGTGYTNESPDNMLNAFHFFYEQTGQAMDWSQDIFIKFYLKADPDATIKLGHFYVKTFKQAV